MRLTRKQWLLVAVLSSVALYFLLRKKTPNVKDASDSKAMSDLFDKLNPELAGGPVGVA